MSFEIFGGCCEKDQIWTQESFQIFGGGRCEKGQIWTQERKLEFSNFRGGVVKKVRFGLRKEN